MRVSKSKNGFMVKKFLKQFVTWTAVLTMALPFSACGGNVTLGVCPAEVEQGMYLLVPEISNAKDVTYTVVDPKGKTVKARNDRVLMEKLGEYTITYQYSGGSKSVTVKCVADKTGPYINKDVTLKQTYYVGEEVFPNGLDLDDPSGVSDWDWEYYYENETTRLNMRGTDSIFPERAGEYRLILRAWDDLNNESLYQYSFKVEDLFLDGDVVEMVDGVSQFKIREDQSVLLGDFDDNGYVKNWISSSDSWGTATKNFTIETAEIDSVDTQILRAEPSKRKTEHFVLKYKFFTDFTPRQENGKSIGYFYIRYKVTQRLTTEETVGMSTYDYLPQLYGVPYAFPDSGMRDYIDDGNAYNFNPKDGEWAVARVPVSYFTYGQNKTIAGLKFGVCGEVCIDEIWYDSYEFTDGGRALGVLADFDEDEYLYQVGVDSFGDPPVIDHLSTSELVDMDGDRVDTAGHTSGMLVVSSKDQRVRWATATIKFFDDVIADENVKLEFVIYYDGRLGDEVYSNVIFMHKDNNNWKDGSRYDNPIDSSNGYKYAERWITVTIDSTKFANAGEAFNQIKLLVEGTLYIDEIRLVTA